MKKNNDKFKIQENNGDKQKNNFADIDSKDVERMKQKYKPEMQKIKEWMEKIEDCKKQIEQYNQKILEFQQKVIQENNGDKQKNNFAKIDSKGVEIGLSEIENNNMDNSIRKQPTFTCSLSEIENNNIDNSYGNTSNTTKEIVDNLFGVTSSERELKNKKIHDISLTLEMNQKNKTNCLKKIYNRVKKIFCCCCRDKKNQTNDINNVDKIKKEKEQAIINNQ